MAQFSEVAELIINSWLPAMIEKQASDLFLSSGTKPMFRINGKLDPEGIPNADVIANFALRQALEQLVAPEYWEQLQVEGATKLTFNRPGLARFRLALSTELTGISAAFRALPLKAPNIENLGIDESFQDRIWSLQKGLVLIGGQPGQGVTTTIAALVDVFNRLRNDRIMCFEDPVEIRHQNKNSVVTQRDIRRQGGDLQTSVNMSMHEQPDTIVIGDSGDVGSFETILQLVEQGFFVVAATPYKTVSFTLERMIASLPAACRLRYVNVLADSLEIALTQTLLPGTRDVRRVAIREVLFREKDLAEIIREQDWAAIPEYLNQHSHLGMSELNQSLLKMVQSVEISARTALRASTNAIKFERQLRRNGIALSNLDTFEKACLEHSASLTESTIRRDIGQRYERASSSGSTRSNRRRGWSSLN